MFREQLFDLITTDNQREDSKLTATKKMDYKTTNTDMPSENQLSKVSTTSKSQSWVPSATSNEEENAYLDRGDACSDCAEVCICLSCVPFLPSGTLLMCAAGINWLVDAYWSRKDNTTTTAAKPDGNNDNNAIVTTPTSSSLKMETDTSAAAATTTTTKRQGNGCRRVACPECRAQRLVAARGYKVQNKFVFKKRDGKN
ncbi:uncharacterized protein B0I36DRAFT_360135 [Microdochium trichocladiopsis]|uniref:Uncharacterized protein n=1 Tax=Microdochium trichocladiopsis TaxID=1682393 RepID=A0A9P8YAT4_9PEZI|nr:uncharacterized protein B0I36DRAFT_360135 [Microdochium trichocladiopsis]KAH7034629.1 hypothetical protein B0I36DRAFT_360135 [Microdochium trichocladiopsis]